MEGFKETRQENFEKKDFIVAIFGGGSESTDSDKLAMADANKLATSIIESGFSVATGGYNTGTMRVASEAAAEKLAEQGVGDTTSQIKAFPLTKNFKNKGQEVPEVENAEIVRSRSLPKRLDHLINEPSAYIVLNGNIGTTVELLTALHSEMLNAMKTGEKFKKPIIIVDESLKHVDTLAALVNKDHRLQNTSVFEDCFVVNDLEKSLEVVESILNSYYEKTQGYQNFSRIAAEKGSSDQRYYKLSTFLKQRDSFESGGGI